MRSTLTLRRAAMILLTAGLAAIMITSLMAVGGVFADDGPGEVDVLLQPAGTTTVAGVTATAPEGVCVDHVFGGEFRDRVFLAENDEIVTDIVAEGGIRVRGDEQWTFCTDEAVTITTTAVETVAGVTATAEAPPAVPVETAAVEAPATEVVAGVAVTAAPEAVEAPAPATVAGITRLPRAGGVPVASGLLAGLGLLLSAGGLAIRRLTP